MSSKKTAKSSGKKKDSKKTKVEPDKVQEIIIDPLLLPERDFAAYPDPEPDPAEPAWAAVLRHSLETVVEVLSETTLSVAELHNRIRVVEEVRLARAPAPLHTVHKLAAGQYEYRGAHISQDDNGRWLVRFEDGTESAGLATLRLARALIDQALLAPEPVPIIDRPGYFDVPEDVELPGMWEQADLTGGETDQELAPDQYGDRTVPVLEDLGEDFFEPVTMTNLTTVRRPE